jgi:hypothetical protein
LKKPVTQVVRIVGKPTASDWHVAVDKATERLLMHRDHHLSLREELGVLISLVVSLGMIILAIIGWWMWKFLAGFVDVMSGTATVEIP